MVFSACGMYMGHFLAWICAGVMGAGAALILETSLSSLDTGEVAYQALGAAGALCVIFAGWATSNPTLYRAGLALQSVSPGWPRWLVTLFAGTGTTIVACFPFIFAYLLDFVGLFGILLAPIAAVVLVEHWVFPRIGLRRYWFDDSRRIVNWAALAVWIIAVCVSLALWRFELLHVLFIAVPVCLLTAVLYTGFAALAGARSEAPEAPQQPESERAPPLVATSNVHDPTAQPSRSVLQIVSGVIGVLSLAACMAFALWVLVKGEEAYSQRLAVFKTYLAVASVVHLIAAAIWVWLSERRDDEDG